MVDFHVLRSSKKSMFKNPSKKKQKKSILGRNLYELILDIKNIMRQKSCSNHKHVRSSLFKRKSDYEGIKMKTNYNTSSN